MIEKVWLRLYGEDVTTKKRTGPQQFRVLCAFHEDRHPSCDISVAKDAFICRSCGAAGGYLDVIIREGLALNRSDAMRWIERNGLK